MMQKAKSFLTALALSTCVLGSSGVSAQTADVDCGGVYTVKRGDWLSKIARRNYGNYERWSVIWQDNIGTIGDNADLIFPGQELNISCIEGRPTGLPQHEVVGPGPQPVDPNAFSDLRVLTGGDYAPFTDEGAEDKGMLYVVVDRALDASNDVASYKITFVNDWSRHLDELLRGGSYDLGFPWFQPDCSTSNSRCDNFIFSEPLFEMLIVMFVREGNRFVFNEDSDIEGKTLCRPSGYFTHDLEKGGRLWLTRDVITLKQPITVAECFNMLIAGEVDAVAINEFTGRVAVRDLGLDDSVTLVENPLSIEALHALVPKNHDRAQELIDAFNEGLDDIRERNVFQSIIRGGTERFWASLRSS